MAHHDDELFIAATMRRLARRGPVAVLWLSQGGLGGPRRPAESVRSMDIIGVPRRNLFFLRLPDNRLLDYLPEIVERLRRLFSRWQPASVFVPAFEGGHQDHDTAQLAAALALARPGLQSRRQPRLYEFPLYRRRAGRLLAVGSLLEDPAAPVQQTPVELRDRLLKQKLARVYASQRLIVYPLLAIKGGPMMLHPRGEPYREVPPGRDYTAPPHPGRPAYEYYTRRRFGRFAARARAASS
ncbi:MAG: PIG-L family deacetylase [Actinomycetota bacterium]|nr:PIG-L family deacetylase [Actinomycetota bacterium]